MSFDHRGQVHAGSIGLFDDEDEYIETQNRLIRNQNEELWTDERHRRAEEKRAAKKLAKADSPSFFRRLFGRQKKKQGVVAETPTNNARWIPPATAATTRPMSVQRLNELTATAESENKDGEEKWPEYDAEEVIETDSPFYNELGLVLVRGRTAAENVVVPRSQIRARKSEKAPENLLD
jgi:hypothetical protein